MAITFNQRLKSMAEELQQELPGSVFLYSNVFGIAMDLIQNPSNFGMYYFMFIWRWFNPIINKELKGYDCDTYRVNNILLCKSNILIVFSNIHE